MTTGEHATTTIALVTGASHGLGLEVVRQLAQRGMTVILTARSEERGKEATEQLAGEGLRVSFKPLDVTDDASVDRLARQVGEEFGRLDVLINNAATNFDFQEQTLSADLSAVRETFETNVFGAWRMAKAFVPLLRKSAHARLVNVGSGAGSFGAPEGLLATKNANLPAYSISKLALNGLTLKLAAELEGSNILVNSVCPGTTASYPGMEHIPGARPIQEGAASIIWAALLPDDGPRGGFYRDGKPLAW